MAQGGGEGGESLGNIGTVVYGPRSSGMGFASGVNTGLSGIGGFDSLGFAPSGFFDWNALNSMTPEEINALVKATPATTDAQPSDAADLNKKKLLKDILGIIPGVGAVSKAVDVAKDVISPPQQPPENVDNHTIDVKGNPSQSWWDASSSVYSNVYDPTANLLLDFNGTPLVDPTAGQGDIVVTGAKKTPPPSTEVTTDPNTGEIVVTAAKKTPPTQTDLLPLVTADTGFVSSTPSLQSEIDPASGEIVVKATKKTTPAPKDQFVPGATDATGETPITVTGQKPNDEIVVTGQKPNDEIVVTGTKPQPTLPEIPPIIFNDYTPPPVGLKYIPPAAPTPTPTPTPVPPIDTGGITGVVSGTGTGGAGGTTDTSGTIGIKGPSLAYNPAMQLYNNDWQFPKEYTPLKQINLPNYPTVYDILFQGQGAQSPLGQSMLSPSTRGIDTSAKGAASQEMAQQIANQQLAQQTVDQALQQAMSSTSSAPKTSTGKAHGGSVNKVIDDIIAYLHHFRR